MMFPRAFTIIDDHGMVVSVFFWLLLIIILILFSIALLNVIKLCMVCCNLGKTIIVLPARHAYDAYKNFMQIKAYNPDEAFLV
ncbi:envelope protein [Feline coronavirus UU18]|uniref:Envelope small membrane protein n=1 Tax=Feline coronavirus UU18 TaxID=871679 RepID=E0AGV9_9ALPC|nr:envelope protein [Feline coronavirus UU18]